MENNKKPSISTKTVVAIGVGAALYFALSYVSITIAPNTYLKPAIALLTFFGAMFGPLAGFFIGLIGHALFDALSFGSVWWSWVLLSAVLGFSQGLIFKSKSFSVTKGLIEKKHIVLMIVYSAIGIIVAGLCAFAGDVYLYKEAAEKVWLQIVVSSITNYAVVVLLGIPIVVRVTNTFKNKTGLDN